MTRLITFADADAAAERAAAEIAQRIGQAREQRGSAHLVLSGGGTPERTYELLVGALREWQGVEVWFADERCVGPEDEQSNYRMAREKLLQHVPLAPERIHRMEGELGPEQGAQRYGELLSGVAPGEERLPVLDVVVLGIGPDGHVASLFPEASTLKAPERAVCLGVHDSPKPPPQRITLSLAMLRAARGCLLLATGASKAHAITGALGEPTPRVPASLLRRERLTVILDDAASPSPDGLSGDAAR
ncbi:MAG TPA: 6-phosphogluconolactonase [Solirubrobacteraceae bacterium]